MEELFSQEDYFAFQQKACYRGQLGQPWQIISKQMICKLFNQVYKEEPQYEYEIPISKNKENKKVKRRKNNKINPFLEAKCQNILKMNKEALKFEYNFCQQDSFQCYKLRGNSFQILKKKEQPISHSKPLKAASYLKQIKNTISEKQEIQYETVRQEKEKVIVKQEIQERKSRKKIENREIITLKIEQKQRLIRSKSTVFVNKNSDCTVYNSPKGKREEHFVPEIKLKSKSLQFYANKQLRPFYLKKSSNKHLPAIFCFSKQCQSSESPIHCQIKKRKISLLKHSLSKSKQRDIGKYPKQTLKSYIEKERLILNGKYRLFLNQRPARLKISSLIPTNDPRNQARLQ